MHRGFFFFGDVDRVDHGVLSRLHRDKLPMSMAVVFQNTIQAGSPSR
jgi:hypothetical protein